MTRYSKAVAAVASNGIMALLAAWIGPAVLENAEVSGAVLVLVNGAAVWWLRNTETGQ